MELNVLERILLVQTLPSEGSFTNLKLLRLVKEALSFDEEENKSLNFVMDGDMMRWDESAAIVKDVEIGDVVHKLIKKKLMALDEQEKLTENHISLYDKFV